MLARPPPLRYQKNGWRAVPLSCDEGTSFSRSGLKGFFSHHLVGCVVPLAPRGGLPSS